MAKKIKPDDIVEALLDSRVVHALAKALAPFIALTIEESLTKKMESLTTAMRELKSDNTRLTKQCDNITAENISLKKTIDEQGRRIDDLDSYSRCQNLIIRGLPENSTAERATEGADANDRTSIRDSHQAVEKTVVSFCRDSLGIDVSQTDIAIAHRLKSGPKDVTRPVIVRFVNRGIRNLVYHARKQLKGQSTRVFISEHLTKFASDLFFDARKLQREKKINSTWTQSGQVYVKFTSDPAARPIPIKCKADLNPRC
jgi:hypothetical protein